MDDLTKVRWVVIDGCIFTEKQYEVRFPSGRKFVRFSVAFNVGSTVANRIVELHNSSLPKD